MTRPSKEDIETALQHAENIREQDNDVHHIARALLYLHHKTTLLDKLYHDNAAAWYPGLL